MFSHKSWITKSAPISRHYGFEDTVSGSEHHPRRGYPTPRFSENVKHFFECFCEVVPPTADKEAWIIQQYPDKYKDEEVLKAVPKFAYPYKFEKLVIGKISTLISSENF